MSTPLPPPRPIRLGSVDVISVLGDELLSTSGVFASSSAYLAETALVMHRYVLDYDFASDLLDPAGAADVVARLLANLDGPAGLLVLAAETGAVAVELRAAAQAYQGVDLLKGGPEEIALNLVKSKIAGPLAHLELGIAEVAEVANVAPWISPLIAIRLNDGRPRVTALPAETDSTTLAPTTLRGEIAQLAERNDADEADAHASYVSVSVIAPTASGDKRHVVVDIPGLKNASPLATGGAQPADLLTADLAAAGRPNTYENGIIEAMEQAGVTADDDVMLVGHSLGGMVAVNTATHLAKSGHFKIGHVITAGSPIGQISKKLPSTVNVLALENKNDPIPLADAIPNPARRSLTTVTVDRGNSGPGLANHGLDDNYVPGANDVDHSDNRATRAYIDSLDGSLTGGAQTTTNYKIVRS